MAIVSMICKTHGYIQGDHCPQCVKQQRGTRGVIDKIDPKWCHGWYEHIDKEPIFIKSKEHLLRECDKRGVYPKAFMRRKSQGKGVKIV